jgi:hypothetical protein
VPFDAEGSASLENQEHLNGSAQGRCQWQLIQPRHGSKVKVKVTCMNGVHLQTKIVSDLVTVLLQPPTLNQV